MTSNRKPWLNLIGGALALTTLMVTAASAQDSVGGDIFVSGADATISGSPARDAFAAGFSATLEGNIVGDGHAAGFDVDVDGSVGGDLYASGASVSVTGTVGEDLTVTGFSTRLRSGGRVEGNARMMAGSVRVDGPVEGSLMAAGGSVTLNAPVAGDVRLTGARIELGNDARIGGNLVYSAPEEVDIPTSVIPAERVQFIELTGFDGFEGWRENVRDPADMFWPSLLAVCFAFVVTLAFLLVVAALLLALVPKRVDQAHQLANNRAWLSLAIGFLTMALVFGLVPVSSMSIIGVPFIPIVLLLVVLLWVAAYLLGAFTLSLRIGRAFGAKASSNVAKLLVTAAGLVALALLNFVPILGWLLNFAVVLLGVGAIALLAIQGIDLERLRQPAAVGTDDDTGADEPDSEAKT